MFDLLVSLYAGFISEACDHLPTVGCLLLANSSHGDAALVALEVSTHRLGEIRERPIPHRRPETRRIQDPQGTPND